MATLSDLASHHYHDSHSHHNHHHHHRSSSHRSSSSKIAKGARGGHKVKPILKRLASTSSPKNSLDLDRGWEDQVVDLGYGSPTSYDAGRPSMSPSLRDVNFHLPQAWEPTGYSSAGEGASGPFGATSAPGRASGTATPVGSGPSIGPEPSAALTSSSALLHNGATATARSIGRGRYQHTRSASAASHVSIGTNGSNHRPGGSFVHPFQQTPRTSTPPLTCANSFTSFERENNPARDYSPTIITENDDDDDDLDHPPHASHHLSQSFAASSHLNRPQPSNSHSTTSLRRPSLGSQRTSSLSDMRNHLVNNHHSHTTTSSSGTSSHTAPLRVNTTPSFPRSVPTSARLAHASLTTPNSASDLHLSISPTDSPRPSIHLASPSTASTAAMTPFRTSLEGTFRLRSRSDIETGVRHEDIREARRKFEEAERIKQEKYEAEQRRKQERKAEKERAAAARRNTGASDISNGSRPSFSRRRSPPLTSAVGSITGSRRARSHRSTTSHHGGAAAATTMTVMNEKTEGVSTGFLSSNYESMAGGEMPNYEPDINDVHFGTPMRANTTKRKTQGYWTAFVLWFRTRLLKLGRH